MSSDREIILEEVRKLAYGDLNSQHIRRLRELLVQLRVLNIIEVIPRQDGVEDAFTPQPLPLTVFTVDPSIRSDTYFMINASVDDVRDVTAELASQGIIPKSSQQPIQVSHGIVRQQSYNQLVEHRIAKLVSQRLIVYNVISMGYLVPGSVYNVLTWLPAPSSIAYSNKSPAFIYDASSTHYAILGELIHPGLSQKFTEQFGRPKTVYYYGVLTSGWRVSKKDSPKLMKMMT